MPSSKPLKAPPRNAVRRSAQDRERLRLEKEQEIEAQRASAARDREAEAERRRLQYGISNRERDRDVRPRGGNFSRGGGRGGFMGQQRSRQGQGQAQGWSENAGDGMRPMFPPSRRAGTSMGGTSRGGGSGSGSGSGGVGGVGGAGSSDGQTGSRGRRTTGKSRVKEEIGPAAVAQMVPDEKMHVVQDLSSDDDEMEEMLNVDYINLVSDGEDDADTAEARGTRARTFAGQSGPVRVTREEHHERTMDVRTEPLTGGGKKKGDGESTGAKVDAKAKGPSKDVEYLGGTSRWKGVYQDSDDELPIKKEEPADEGAGDNGDPDNMLAHSLHPDKALSPTRVKSKPHRTDNKISRMPAFISVEEKRELEALERFRKNIVEELGPGDSIGENDELATVNKNRQDATYLFQIPTSLPELEALTIASTSNVTGTSSGDAMNLDPTPTEKEPVKQEESADALEQKEALSTTSKFPFGKVGKLRIHASGRAELSWGGIPMTLNAVLNTSMLQMTVLTKIDKNIDGGGDVVKGEAVSFGQIRGKMHIRPDFDVLLK